MHRYTIMLVAALVTFIEPDGAPQRLRPGANFLSAHVHFGAERLTRPSGRALLPRSVCSCGPTITVGYADAWRNGSPRDSPARLGVVLVQRADVASPEELTIIGGGRYR